MLGKMDDVGSHVFEVGGGQPAGRASCFWIIQSFGYVTLQTGSCLSRSFVGIYLHEVDDSFVSVSLSLTCRPKQVAGWLCGETNGLCNRTMHAG